MERECAFARRPVRRDAPAPVLSPFRRSGGGQATYAPGENIAMRVLLQRVSSASVSVDGQVVGEIGRGFCLLVGFTHADTAAEVEAMVDKVAGLRLFADAEGRMNLALGDVGGALLVVSQFTLYGDASRGRRPSFVDAARPEVAVPLYEEFCARLAARGLVVATGRFGASMVVDLRNDGPVTLMLEKEKA
jgi:D-tyrosyl-tRNA(Tyr) deacylase